MINYEHAIVQRVVLVLNFNNLDPMRVTKIALRNYVRNISGTFQETTVRGICQKKSQQRARS